MNLSKSIASPLANTKLLPSSLFIFYYLNLHLFKIDVVDAKQWIDHMTLDGNMWNI